jgi:hypothetical protein
MTLRPPHLLVSLSPHGYGHAAMTAPMVEALRLVRPDLRLTLQTSTPLSWLKGRYAEPFGLIAKTPDFGMVMESALKVLPEDSHRRYQDLHGRLEHVVEAEAAMMTALGVDLVLSNISYVALLAAKKAGIPAVAMSCLNWHEIYGAYCRHLPGATDILARMQEAYAGARSFLCPAPSLPMPGLPNVLPIGPLARLGTPQKAQLATAMVAEQGSRFGLVAFGGMELPLDFARWPRLEGWKWIVCGDPNGHPDMLGREKIPLSFNDLMCSCDLVIGKPGYGTFVEAGVNGIPMLYLPRPDWPESADLQDWLSLHGRTLPISLDDMFQKDRLECQLRTLFSLDIKPVTLPTGVDDGVRVLQAILG